MVVEDRDRTTISQAALRVCHDARETDESRPFVTSGTRCRSLASRMRHVRQVVWRWDRVSEMEGVVIGRTSGA